MFQVDLMRPASSPSVLFPIISHSTPQPPSTSCQTGVKASAEMDRQMDGKQEGAGKGMDGRREERERCDPLSRAWSIYRRKCPNWQAAGRTTALHWWYPTPCPSTPQPLLLPVLSSDTPSSCPLSPTSFFCPHRLLFHMSDLLSFLPLTPPLFLFYSLL